MLEAHLVELGTAARPRRLPAHDLPRVVEPDRRRAIAKPSGGDLGEEAREIGTQGEQAPVPAHEGAGLGGERLGCKDVRVVEQRRDDLLVVPALEDGDDRLLDAPAPPRLFTHEALDAGGDLGETVAVAHHRPSSSAPSAASRMASTGAGTPVHVSNCPAAWARSISSPSTVTQPAACAARSSGVGRGS